MTVFEWLHDHPKSTLKFRYGEQLEAYDSATGQKVDVDLGDTRPIFMVLQYCTNIIFELSRDRFANEDNTYNLTVTLKLPYVDENSYLHYNQVFHAPVIPWETERVIGDIVSRAMSNFHNMIYGVRGAK